MYGTKRDAERALREIMQQRDRGVRVQPTTIRLDASLDDWLSDVAPLRRRAGTVAHYAEMLRRYVRPALGAIRLDQLSPRDVQRVRAAADRLGHASAKMTLDVYAHALPAQVDETTAILERDLGGD